MTKDLLDLNRVETTEDLLNLKEIDPTILANWAENHFAQTAKNKKVILKITAEAHNTTFESDRTMIQSILQNLIDNAIKFMPADGWVECNIRLEENQLCIQVSDTGCGIPTDMQDKIFERFFQVEQSRTGDTKIRGTGLGLAIVKHTTERLGGSIHLKSMQGKGTTITVMIPKSSPKPSK